jgi:adenylyltransferase/sulfurtransferase
MKPEQQQRYARHLSLEGFGRVAQEKLLASTVLMVGAGGLGCPAAQYLAAAGVGRLIIMDDDQVELSNLQRQILHGHSHVGMNKALSAQKRILEINPDTEVMAIQERCTEANVRNWVSQADVILDGADNFPTRYLLNITRDNFRYFTEIMAPVTAVCIPIHLDPVRCHPVQKLGSWGSCLEWWVP